MEHLIEPVVSGCIRTAGAVAGHTYRVASHQRGVHQICVRILLDSLHNLREGLSLFTRSEVFGDAQKRILEESIEAVAQISTANSLHECPKLLWSALPAPVFEMLKSLQPWTEDTHIQEAKTKFQTSLKLCEVLLGTTGDSHFLCWLKTLAVGFKVICTMLYHIEHPSMALATCKGYLHTLSHIKLKKNRRVILHIHALVWQFSFICCDSSVREAWPLVQYKERKPCHPVLYFGCVPGNMVNMYFLCSAVLLISFVHENNYYRKGKTHDVVISTVILGIIMPNITIK